MDECTSNQDYETEKYMQNELFTAFDPEQTVIVIAHRLNTLKFCDLILVLKDGELIEQGSERELLKLNGEYCRLYDAAKDGIL